MSSFDFGTRHGPFVESTKLEMPWFGWTHRRSGNATIPQTAVLRFASANLTNCYVKSAAMSSLAVRKNLFGVAEYGFDTDNPEGVAMAMHTTQLKATGLIALNDWLAASTKENLVYAATAGELNLGLCFAIALEARTGSKADTSEKIRALVLPWRY